MKFANHNGAPVAAVRLRWSSRFGVSRWIGRGLGKLKLELQRPPQTIKKIGGVFLSRSHE